MNSKLLAVALISLAAVGCASTSGDDTEAGNNALSAESPTAPASTTTTLKAQMTACEDVEKALVKAGTTAEMIQDEGNTTSCYKKASDSHVAEIDNLRHAAKGQPLAPATLSTQHAFDDYRANTPVAPGAPALALCDLEHDASATFGGSLEGVNIAACRARTEIRLAKLVLSETTLPGGNVALTKTASDTDVNAFATRIADLITHNDTSKDPLKVSAAVIGTINAERQAAIELCQVLEDAGQGAGGTIEAQLASGCLDRARGLFAEELAMIAQSPNQGD